MLTVDIAGALAKAITPSRGIPHQEFVTLATGLRRYVQDWLKEREEGQHAWSMNPYDRTAVSQVKEVAQRLHQDKVRTVVWIGIGGSSLAPRVMQDVLEGPETLELIVVDSIDPAALAMLQRIVDWKQTQVIVVSKSGETLEPMSTFALCWSLLKQTRGAEHAAERVLALTDPEHGSLRSFCIDHGIPMLPIPRDVGGRYSVFTPVGLLPLALLGGDVEAFVRGAKDMDTVCQQTVLEENPAATLAAAQFLLDTKRGYGLRVVMPYSHRLESIARWEQQLIAESLGKNEVGNPIPIAAVGTQDQHSLLQQWMSGPHSFWHLFIREREHPRVVVPEDIDPAYKYLAGKTYGQIIDACYEGTSQALTSAKRPHGTITIPRLDEEHLGQLFYLFMTEVALLGKLYRIDPYGQPAVEIGKQITKGILSRGAE